MSDAKKEAPAGTVEYVAVKTLIFGKKEDRKVIEASTGKKVNTVKLDPNGKTAQRFLAREAIVTVADYKKAQMPGFDEPEAEGEAEPAGDATKKDGKK